MRPATTAGTTGSRVDDVVITRPRSVSSEPNRHRSTPYSMPITTNQGTSISSANWMNEMPDARSARRLVRFETGSRIEALLARCAHAYTCGRAGTRTFLAVVSTTGVSSTTVASSDRTAVTIAPAMTTSTRRRWPRPRLPRPIWSPAQRNSPDDSHMSPTTRIAARNSTTGSSRRTSAQASWPDTAPTAMTTMPAGTAATASGRPRGRMTAKASTRISRTPEIASTTSVYGHARRARPGVVGPVRAR